MDITRFVTMDTSQAAVEAVNQVDDDTDNIDNTIIAFLGLTKLPTVL